jgi:hypothetical protein
VSSNDRYLIHRYWLAWANPSARICPYLLFFKACGKCSASLASFLIVAFFYECIHYHILRFKIIIRYIDSVVNGLLPKSLFTLSKMFLINLRLVPGALKTRPLGSDSSKRLSSTSPRLKRKNVLGFGQQPVNN